MLSPRGPLRGFALGEAGGLRLSTVASWAERNSGRLSTPWLP
jgi:hypothetical protein